MNIYRYVYNFIEVLLSWCYDSLWRVLMTGWQPPEPQSGFPELYGREGTYMTVYEIVMIVLRVINTLISLGSLVISLLSFLYMRKKRK